MGEVITMVVTATVASDVEGVVVNWARSFGDTDDPVAANNSDSASTDITKRTQLAITKTDLADPVYAGDTYFYEIVITNSGPSLAENLIVTDTLPGQVTYAGGSPACAETSSGSGVVVCTVGALGVGETQDYLINVTLSDSVVSPTVGINTVLLTTTTPVADSSVLTASAATTYWQRTGAPTDLILDKAATVTAVNAGTGVFTYTLTITNAGPAPASAVQVVDALPPAFDFVSAVTSRDSAVALCNSGIVCDLGTLLVDERVSITVVATIPSEVSAGTYTNTAHVSSPAQELNQANNTSQAAVTVSAPATLAVTKAATPDPATPGNGLAYTIIVTNSGPAVARNVVVSDTLPTGYTADVVVSTRGSCTVSGQLFTCALGDLAVDEIVTIVLNGTLAADGFVQAGPGASPVVTVTALITNGVAVRAENATAIATAQITTALQPRADLAVTKAGPVNAAPGDTIRYTVTVENLGPSAAPYLFLTDTLPSDLTFVTLTVPTGSACGVSSNLITCTQGALAAGAELQWQITATVNNDVALGTDIQNSVRVATDAIDPVASNNRATVDTAINGSSDLSLTKAQFAPAGAVTVGQLVTYVLTVTNRGPGVAENVIVRDVPPSGLQLLQMTGSRGTCSGDSCLLGTLALSETGTITVVARVNAQSSATTLVNNAIATSDNERNYADNIAAATTTIAQRAELVITKRADPVVAVPGDDLTYELIVTNRGPSAAAAVTISDTLPNGFTAGTISSDPAGCATLPCTIDQLHAHETIRVLIQGRVAPTVTTALVNRATVTSITPLTDTGGTGTTITTTVAAAADLALVKTAPVNAVAGAPITYTLTVFNHGPSAAAAVVVTDSLPADVTFQSAAVGCGESAGVVTCTVGALAPGASQTMTITVTAGANLPAGTALRNRATVGSATADPVPGNNSDDATTTIIVSADLAVAKRGPTTAVAGESITYTIVLTNNGPGTPHWLDLKDTVPTGLTAQQVTAVRSDSGTAACAGQICQGADLAAGGVMTMTVVALVDPSLPVGTLLTNRATLFSDALDPTTADHSATVTTTVTTVADLTVHKVALAESVAPASGLLYEISVFNHGPSAATAVTISDTLDSNVTFAGASAGCTTAGAVVSCTVGTLLPDSTATFLVAVTANDVVSGTVLTNRVAVTSSTGLTNTIDDTDLVTTTVEQDFGPTADLGIIKTGSPATVTAGERVTYTLVVTNGGPQTATNVRLLDLLPTGLTLLTTTVTNPEDGSALCTLGGSCRLGTLAAGGVATATLVAQMDANLAAIPLQNQATVAADQRDPAPANNLAATTTAVTVAADLALAKRALNAAAAAGETLLYQLVVTNNGPSTANGVVVTDTLPAGLTAVGASPGCSTTGDRVTCTQNSVAVGATTTFLIETAVADTLVAGTLLTNTAVVTSTVTDLQPLNNLASTTTEAAQSAHNPTDLAIAKGATPDPVTAGEQLTYTLAITNLGPTTATNVVLVDALPSGVTADQIVTTQGLCTRGGLCVIGDLAVDALVQITIATTVAPDQLGTLRNEARVTAANPDPEPANNRAAVTTAVATAADLEISKTVDPTVATPGAPLRYQIVVTNTGPSVARGVTISDTLPAAFSNVRFTGSQGSCDGLGGCAVATLAPGARLVIDVAGIVASDLMTALVNSVTVTSTTADSDGLNNRAVVTAPLAAHSDLAVALDSTPTVNAGDAITVTVTLYNLGPSAASGTVVTVTLPPSTTFGAAQLPTGWFGVENGDGTVTITTTALLTAGAALTLPFTMVTDGTIEPGSSLAFTAEATSANPDPNLSNNRATSDSSIIGNADLQLTKRGPLTVTAGTAITYTILVTNSGPSVAHAVAIQDQLPTGVTVVQSRVTRTGTGNALCSAGSCQLGDLAIGEVVTMSVVGLVDSTLASGSTLTNRATVFAVSPDPVASNDSDSHVTTVATAADLRIAKAALPATAVPGATVTYLLTVDNAGPSAAIGVVVSDTLPAGFTVNAITSSQGTCSALPCAVGTVGVDEQATVTVVGTVASTVTTGLVNRAAVSAGTPDPAPLNNRTVITTNVSPSADLALDLAATPTVDGGEQLTVTATLVNQGPSHADGIRLTVTLPASTTFAGALLPADWFGVDNGDGTVTITTTQHLAPGEPVALPLRFAVDPAIRPGSSLEFTAEVTAATPDPNLLDNGANADSSVIAVADLIITKVQETANPIVAGGLVTYTITITNIGPGSARAVDVKDELPVGMSLAAISAGTDGICGGTVCQFGTVPVNATRVVTVVARVNSGVTAAALTNRAAVFSPDDDDPVSANRAQVTTAITTVANLRVHKIDYFDPVAPGGDQLYQILVYNDGPSDAQQVVITDVLDSNVAFVNASPECSAKGRTVTCALGSLAAQSSAGFFVAVNVSEALLSASQLTNIVTATTTTNESTMSDNRSTATTTIANFGTLADLSVQKRTASTLITAGETVTYTMTVTNAGPSAASNVRLLDLLPAETTLVGMQVANSSDPNAACSLGGSCYLGTIFTNTVVVLTATVRVDSDYAAPTLQNKASIAADQSDTNAGNNFSTVTTPVVQRADLALAKQALIDPVIVGEVVPYQIVITNAGPSDAANVVVTDLLPSRVAFAGATPGCLHDGSAGGGTVRCELGTVPAGAIRSLLLDVQVDPSLALSTTLTNTATVTSTVTDPNGNNNTDSARVLAEPGALLPVDLVIAKAVTPANVTAGESLTYTLVVTNGGPGVASNVRLIDALPVGMRAVTVTPSQGLCTEGIVCEFGDLSTAATATVTVVALVDSATAPGALTNRARVVAANPDRDLSNNQAAAAATVTVDDNLQLAKLGPVAVHPGQTIRYQIVVTNTGPSAATNVVVSDTVPGTVTSISALANQGTCTISGQQVTCLLGLLAPGATAVIAVDGQVENSATGTLVNRATVTSEADPTGTTDSVTTTITQAADLTLDLMTTPTVNSGEGLTATIVLYNQGPSHAENLVVTLTLPAGTTLAGAPLPIGWIATDKGDGPVTVRETMTGTQPLTPGVPLTLPLLFTVDSGIPSGTSLEFSALVTSTTADPNLFNNRADADSTVMAAADLAIAKRQVTAQPIVAGRLVTYTLTLTNSGPSTARAVDVADELPTGMTLERIAASHGGLCGGAHCQFDSIPVNATRTVTVVAHIDSDTAAGTLVNRAALFALDDANPANNRAQATTLVTTLADLTLHKVALDASVAPLGTMQYELTLFNRGPSTAHNLVVTDTLDSHVTFAAASPACLHDGAADGGTVACTVETLAPNHSATFLIAVQAGDLLSGTIITNQATVAGSTPLTNTVDDSALVTTTVVQDLGPTADLGLTKTGMPVTVVAGERVTYTLVVTNGGPQAATNVELLDLIPTGAEAVAVRVDHPTDSTAQCGLSGSCLLGTLAPSARVTVTLVLAVAGDFEGTTLVNTAAVRGDQRDPHAANNLATATTAVTTVADLAISKEALATTVSAGEMLLYQLVITNRGPSVAAAPVVTDTLPAGVSLIGGSPGCIATDNSVRCTLATLAPGATTTLLMQTRVDESVADGTLLTNLAMVASATTDSNPANNVDSADSTVTQQALNPTDLLLTKRAMPVPVVAGEAITYTLTITNLGPATATDVLLVDALPAGLQVTASGTGQGLCTTGGICTVGELPVLGVARVTIVGKVIGDQLDPLFNEAHVTAANPDPVPANNRAWVETPVETVADLQISKVADPLTATPGNPLSYRIVVSNTGPSAAQRVVVSDTLPAALTNVRFSTSQGSCDGQGRCALGTLLPDAEVVVRVVGTVPAGATTPLVNRVTVTSTTADPVPADNRSVVTTPLAAVADLHLDLASTPTVNGGETITVTATVVNQGPSHAAGTVVTVTLPTSTTVVGDRLPVGWFALVNGDGTVTITTTHTLTPGVAIDLPILVMVDSGVEPGSSLAFSGVVTATTPDPDLTDNRATSDTSVLGQADLALTKRGPAVVTAGLPVTYTIVVTNHGPSVAHFVDIKDQLPVGLTLHQATVNRSGQGTQACAGAICQLGDMAVNEVVIMTVVADVAPELPAGSPVTNSATVFAVTADPDAGNNRADQHSTVETAADLAVTKRALPVPAIPGEALTYLIEVTNRGPSDAADVMVDDLLPVGFSMITTTSSLGGCVALPCALGTLPAGDSGSVTLVGVVASEVTAALVNNATVTSSTPDPQPADNRTTVTTTVSPQANLELELRSTPTVNGGENAVVTMTVVNRGPSNAVGGVVTLTLPPQITLAGTQLPTGWSVTDNGDGTVTLITNDPLLPDQVATLPVVVAVADSVEPGSSLAFSGVVTATTPDPDLTDNRATSDTSVLGQADLALTKRGPAVVTAGLPVTYTIVVTNHGPSVAHFVDIKDQLPVGLTLHEATISRSGQGTQACAGAICQLGDMAVNEVVIMTVVADVAPELPAGSPVTNSATVFAVTADPDAGNNSDTQRSTADTYTRLRVEKRDLIDPVAPGALLMYQIDVVNDGPSVARNVVVTDTLPAGLTYMNSTGTCAEVALGLLRCAIGTLAPHTVAGFQVVVTVQPTLVNGAVLLNQAQARSDTPLTGDSILTDSEETVVQEFLGAPADLRLEKRTAAPTVLTGDRITYTLVVTNRGPASATDVKLVDVLPDGLTLLHVESTQGICTQGVNCLLGTLPYHGAPTAATVTLVAQVARHVAEGTLLVNRALVQANQPDPDTANNVDDATVRNQTAADLIIAKAAAFNPAAAGAPIRYTIVVTNAGPSDAINLRITDTLPVALTNVTINSTLGSCQANGICRIDRLPAGTTAVIDLYGTVAATATDRIENRVVVTSDTSDPNPANNSDSVVTWLIGYSDLAVLIDTTPTVQAGEQATATVTVYNYGPSAAPGTVVQVTVPPGATLTSTAFPAGWTLAGNTNGILTIVATDPVPPLVPVALPFVVTFASDLDVGSSHQFDVAISGNLTDPDPLNNRDDADTSIVGVADLLVNKWTSTVIAVAGDTVLYTITVSNQGPSLASNVDVKELLPPELNLLQLSAGQGACVSRICQLGSLPVGETAVVTVVTQVAVGTPVGTLVNNTAAIFSGSMDPVLVNNEALQGMMVGPVSDLMITKRSNVTFAHPSSVVPFHIEVVNRGPSVAPAVVFTDTLPAGFAYQQTDSRCRATTQYEVVCTVGTMAVNEVVNLTLLTEIQPDVAHGVLRNRVVVGSEELHDPTPANNNGAAELQVINAPTVVEQVTLLATVEPTRVHLQWFVPNGSTAVGFYLRRGDNGDLAQSIRLAATPMPATGNESTYTYTDGTVQPGHSYHYWVEEVYADGSVQVYGPTTAALPAQIRQLYLPLVHNE